MRAPDTKKPGKRRLTGGYVLPPGLRKSTSGALKVPEVMGSPRVLLSGSAASEHQLREALKILDPPSAKRESWRKKIHRGIAFRDMRWSDNVVVDERRSRGRRANTRTRDAVEAARVVLEACGLKLTNKRYDKWLRLSQKFADTNRDIRHHLEASLRDRPLAEKS